LYIALQTQDDMKPLYTLIIALLTVGAINAQSLELSDTFLTFTEELADEPGFDYDQVTLTNVTDSPVTVLAKLEIRCHPADGSGVQFCIPGYCLGPYDANFQISNAVAFTLEPGASTSELTGHLWNYVGTGSAWRIYYFLQSNPADEVYIDLVYGDCADEFVVVGIDENEAETLSVYPNPARGVLNVTTDIAPGTLYSVFDMTGRAVASGQINAPNMRIDISNLTVGQYIIEMAASRVRFAVQ
jgi:hypothetical protein